MNEMSVRKTYKEKLRPTPAQERQLEAVLWRCRTLYNTVLEQRVILWKQCGISVGRYQQETELTDLRAAFPEYAAIHSHVLQDVLARLDKTYQGFSGAWRTERSQGFLDSKVAIDITPSPTTHIPHECLVRFSYFRREPENERVATNEFSRRQVEQAAPYRTPEERAITTTPAPSQHRLPVTKCHQSSVIGM